MKLFLPNNAEDRLKETFFLVETSEHHSLWQDYSPQSDSPRYPVKSWSQVMDGWAVTVGTLTTFKPASDIKVGSTVIISREGLTNGLSAQVKEWDTNLSKWRVVFDEQYQGWYFPSELNTKDKYEIHPIVINLNWAWIDDQLIGFWHACSQLVDHRIIDQWFTQNFDKTHDGGRRSMTDHQNFHLCIQAINTKNKENDNS
jgi:hypothetical protein